MRRGLSSVAAMALTAALAAGPARGQEGDGGARGEERRDLIVVTGAGVEAASGEALQASAVVTREDLLEAPPTGIGDLLADIPGVSTTFFGPAASRPIIRGLGGDRVRLLTNGVSLVDASTASPDHAATSEPLGAERIDILRGPAAIAYGGNAIGGVVNVIDGAIPSQGVEDGFDGQFFLGAGTVDDGSQIAARGRLGLGEIVVSLEGSVRDADDYEIPGFAESAFLRALEEEEEGEEEHEEEEAFGTAPNTFLRIESLGGGAALVGDWGHFGLSVKDYDAAYGLPGGHHHDEEGEEEGEQEEEEEEGGGSIVMEQTRLDLRGEIAAALGIFDHVDLSAGYADYTHSELEGSGEVGTTFDSEGWEGRFALVRGGEQGPWSGSLGLQASDIDFDAVGEEAFLSATNTKELGLFGAVRNDLGGWGWEAGGRVERREVDGADAGERSFDAASIAVGGFLRPQDGVFLGASLGRAERAPTATELFAFGPHLATRQFEVGDPTLGKETGWTLDTHGRVERGRWSLDASAFYAQFQDFIYLAPTGEEDEESELPIFAFVQDDATLWGGEIAAQAAFADWGPWTLSGEGSLEYVRGDTDSFGDLPQLPPLSVTLGAELARSGLSLRGEVVHAFEQDDIAAFELPTDGYTLVNVKATVQPFTGRDVRLVLEARNIGDEEARLHTSPLKDFLPLPGRSFRIAVAGSF